MDEKLKKALLEYALKIKESGWKAGEAIIQKHYSIKNFRKWAYAVGIMTRAQEILESRTS